MAKSVSNLSIKALAQVGCAGALPFTPVMPATLAIFAIPMQPMALAHPNLGASASAITIRPRVELARAISVKAAGRRL